MYILFTYNKVVIILIIIKMLRLELSTILNLVLPGRAYARPVIDYNRTLTLVTERGITVNILN